MVGKLAPNSTHSTRELVKYVSGRGYFRAVSSQNGEKVVTFPPPPSLNESGSQTTGTGNGGDGVVRTGKTKCGRKRARGRLRQLGPKQNDSGGAIDKRLISWYPWIAFSMS